MPNRREKGKDEQPRERPSLFQKTKMCKFHLVGICTKGSACVFAHNREELNALPDLSRTKLCKTLINTGVCNDKRCRYAHNKEQLRTTSVFSRNEPCRFWQEGHCELGDRCNYVHTAAAREEVAPGPVPPQASGYPAHMQPTQPPLPSLLMPYMTPPSFGARAQPEQILKAQHSEQDSMGNEQQVVVLDAKTLMPLLTGTMKNGECHGSVKVSTWPSHQGKNGQGNDAPGSWAPTKDMAPGFATLDQWRDARMMQRGDKKTEDKAPCKNNGWMGPISPLAKGPNSGATLELNPNSPPEAPVLPRRIKSIPSMATLCEENEGDMSPMHITQTPIVDDCFDPPPKQQMSDHRAQPGALGQPDRIQQFETKVGRCHSEFASPGDQLIVRNTFLDVPETDNYYPLRPIASCMGRFESLADLGSQESYFQ